jgi:hypothetical protein
LFVLFGGLLLITGCGGPPQLGDSEEALKASEALFTAITAHDDTLLTRSEQRLHALREAGQLPVPAAEALDGMIRTARSGAWDRAAEQLQQFLAGQRRDPHTHDHRPKSRPSRK